MRICAIIQNFDFIGANFIKSWNRYLRKNSQDLRNSPKGAPEAPERPQRAPVGPKSSPRLLQETNSVNSNS